MCDVGSGREDGGGCIATDSMCLVEHEAFERAENEDGRAGESGYKRPWHKGLEKCVDKKKQKVDEKWDFF